MTAKVRFRFSPADWWLLALALLGLGAYAWLLPQVHPDAAATMALGEAEAIDIAEAFLADHEYGVVGLESEAEMRRAEHLLPALQEELGHTGALEALRGDAQAILPAYYWLVEFTETFEETDGSVERRERYALGLLPNGTVWFFDNQSSTPRFLTTMRQALLRHVDRPALEAALAAHGDAATLDTRTLADFSDSLLTARLAFSTFGRTQPDTTVIPANFLETNVLGASAAIAIAQHHLQNTPFGPAGMVADSAWTVPEKQNLLAQVRFLDTTRPYGQAIQATVTVTALGALQSIQTRFNPDREGRGIPLREVIMVVLYLILGIFMFVVFFRRFLRRMIDARAAIYDGLIFGFAMALFVGLQRDYVFMEGNMALWMRIVFGMMGVLLSAAAIALLIFLFTAATDSIARTIWPKKLQTTSLVRQSLFRNVFVGTALVRGLGVGAVLLGLTTVLLWLLPGPSIILRESFLPGSVFLPVVAMGALMAWSAYIVVTLVIVGAGTFFYGQKKRTWLMSIGVVVLYTFINGSLVGLDPYGYSWLFSALAGVVLVVAFWRYDLLTCFIGLFSSGLLWLTSEGWLVEASPALLDFGLAALIIGLLLVVGLVGIFSGDSNAALEEYVPEYVKEVAQQERMTRELELAHEVQAVMLPRRTPHIDGLDLAAMCLSAQEVGGDYYDFVEIGDGRLAVVIGDVSGKGIQAAFYMTLVKGFFRTLARKIDSPAEALRQMNSLFCESAPRGMFITMVYGIIDARERTFTFARAGHNQIILKRSPSQTAETFLPPGLALGLAPGKPFDQVVQEEHMNLRLGDVLVFYTDGFSEAMNSRRDLYGDEQIAEKVASVGHRSANEVLRSVSEDVHHFMEAAGRHDDMTMIVMKLTRRVGGPA